MCRNITTLRGLEPPATTDEIEAAAVQYVRKVTGITKVTEVTREAFNAAVAATAATAQALADLPERRNQPSTVPPLRRDDVAARVAARQAAREEHERLHEQGVPHSH